MKYGEGSEELQSSILSKCEASSELKGRIVVLGSGPVPCDLMVVGEAPGREETRLGRPFVGKAGSFFTRVLEESLERTRRDIYITNVVKVWPKYETQRGKTRPPTSGEIDFFLPLLNREIEYVRPKVVITVGKIAFSAIMPGEHFKRSEWFQGQGGFSVMPVYHPAYILRRQRQLEELTLELKAALSKVKERLS